MRAVVCQNSKLKVVDLPTPRPGRGQVLLDVIRSGICGSDLHARQHSDQQADVLAEAGYRGAMRSDEQVVFGHEFCGRVARYGPGCRRTVPATRACPADHGTGSRSQIRIEATSTVPRNM